MVIIISSIYSSSSSYIGIFFVGKVRGDVSR